MDAEWVVWLLVGKFQTLLLNQAISTKPRLRNQVQKAINNLNLLQRHLKDARIDQQIERRLLGAAYSAEDAIKMFLSTTHLQKQRGSSSDTCLPFARLESSWSQFVFTIKIQKFMAQFQVDGYGNNIVGSSLENVTTPLQYRGITSTSSYLDEKKHVALEDQVTELLGRLIPEQGSNQADTEVIAVVGEAGSGKTTLARIVYDRVKVKQHFKNRVWVNVSNYQLKARDVLFEMLKQVDELVAQAEEPLLEQDLVLRLSEVLCVDRYLIILDDVGAPESWERLRNVFPNSDNGSKIIITTCNADVATLASSSMLQTVRLNNEESWKLFLIKVLFSMKVCIVEDNTFKEQILKLCGGLPLAINLMVGLLSMKECSQGEWLRVIDNARGLSGDNNARGLSGDIFALSYQELPARIKPCFLYMGLFPKAFEIPVRRLFQLWIAEGLVTTSCLGDLVLEDVAYMYLEELINRNMIEVTRWRSDGIPKMCCMPGAIYEIFSPKAAGLGLFYVHCKSHCASGDQAPFPIRRLASYLGTDSYPASNKNIQHLHSYLSFSTGKRGVQTEEIGKFLNKTIMRRNLNLGLLTVLDLEGVYKPRLPKTLGQLLNLRCLGLRSTVLDSLPDSVCELPCLETLDVKHTMIITLPISIWISKSLTHIYMDWIRFDDMSIQSPFDSEPVAKLQTLWGLSLGEQSPVLNILNKMTFLRKLGLKFSLVSQEPIKNWILQLADLRSLRLRSVKRSGEHGSIKFMSSLAKLDKLVDLYLLGVLPRPTDVKHLPPNLKILTLSMTQLSKDPMQVLGRLPHLNVLRLFADSYMGEEMKCPPRGFPQLHVLKLWKLVDLKKWIVEEGAMPCLRELEIRACRRLVRVDGLSHLTTLKELILTNMSSQFAKDVKESIVTDVFIKENDWKPCPLLA